MAGDSKGTPWIVAIIVALIGALGVVAAQVVPKLLDEPTPNPGPTVTSPGPSPGEDGSRTSRISEVLVQGEHTVKRSEGVQTGMDDDVGFLSYVTDGTWATYATEGIGSGRVSSIMTRVASAATGGRMTLRAGGKNGPEIGVCDIAGTGDWLAWTTVACDVRGDVPEGTSQVFAEFSGQGNPYLFNVDWIELQ